MLTVKALCPNCGVVRLKASDITVRYATEPLHCVVGFLCPKCGNTTSQTISPLKFRELDEIEATEIRFERWTWPDELNDPLRYSSRFQSFGPEDALIWHAHLVGDNWFEICQAFVRLDDLPEPP